MGLKLDIVTTEQVKTLVELLDKYSESLPEELLESLKKVADSECFEIGNEEWMESGLDNESYRLMIDGEDVSNGRGIVSINPILKRITINTFGEDDQPLIENKEYVKVYQYPKSFSIGNATYTLVEW